MGRFDQRATRPARGPRDLLRWQLERLRHPRARERFEMRVRAADPSVLEAERPSLTWIGHASFVVRLGGVNVVTDPIWRARIGTRRRLTPPGLPLAAVRERTDVVLISHNHYDHLDTWTIRRFGSRPTYVVPLGNGCGSFRAAAQRTLQRDSQEERKDRSDFGWENKEKTESFLPFQPSCESLSGHRPVTAAPMEPHPSATRARCEARVRGA